MIINNSKLLRVRFTVFFVENEKMRERERESARVGAKGCVRERKGEREREEGKMSDGRNWLGWVRA